MKDVKSKQPNQYHHGDLRAALIDGASSLLEEEGLEGLNLRRLARMVGVSQPALYRHFAGKDELLAAVGEAGLMGLGERTREGYEAATTREGRLCAVGDSYVRHAHAHPGWFRLWFSSSEAQRRLTSPSTPAALLVIDHLARAALADFVCESDPRFDHLFRVMWGLVHGLAAIVVDQLFQRVDTDEERLQAAADAIAHFVALLGASGQPA
ncbi:MAG: TetR/AcrR family transcriptional regulator [Bradymonadaceae bacterium]|nr:TetR/AcrR family transcriptional regulator [Lujinxingiaceae bacterium]